MEGRGQMMVEVKQPDVRVREGVSQRTGKPYRMREQEGWIFLPGSPYPERVKLSLEDDASPYPVGLYPVSQDSFFVGKYQELQVRLRLDRVKRAELKAA